jgi:ATP-dependent DNA helicase RecQ
MPTMTPHDLLRHHFGFDAFRPGQERVIGTLLEGRAALAVFPTGGGKSLCYQLPALQLPGLTLVVSPLIALMKDQIDFLTARGIRAARLDSSLSLAESRAVSAGMQDGSLRLLYVAPERFNNERFLAQLGRTEVSLFAIDEAHCISEWGHNFRPDYLKLAEVARGLGTPRVLALTATATPAVVADICAGFGIAEADVTLTGFYRPNLELYAAPAAAAERDALLVERLRSEPPGPTIVYVTLQRTAERVATALAAAGLPARPYHAGMESEERTAAQEWWMASDRGIVVATIAFGMGIDKADVRAVYHYNLPKSLESYSQEIGRAGRDSAPARVELFACTEDLPVLENFAYGDTPSEGAVRALVEEVTAMEAEFDVSLYELSVRHDIRPLVLRTLLTYLELLGVLRQGTPFYAGYEVRPLVAVPEIAARFPGEPGQFVVKIFDRAKQGRIWYAVNPDEVAAGLGQERRRVVRALEVLEERGLVELRPADARQRYIRLRHAEPAALTAELVERCRRRERSEIDRLQRVLDLVTYDGCQTNALVAYFGEERDRPCGHCTYCRTGRRQTLPVSPAPPPLPDGLDVAAFEALQSAHPDALAEPRQAARFLAGLTSPALTRARLGRHPLFGALEGRRFREILAWLEGDSLSSGGTVTDGGFGGSSG